MLSFYFPSDVLLQLFLVFADLVRRPLSIEELVIHVLVALSRHRCAVLWCTYSLPWGTLSHLIAVEEPGGGTYLASIVTIKAHNCLYIEVKQHTFI